MFDLCYKERVFGATYFKEDKLYTLSDIVHNEDIKEAPVDLITDFASFNTLQELLNNKLIDKDYTMEELLKANKIEILFTDIA